MLERSAGTLPSDVCLPIKAAVAQANALLASGTVDRVFVPALIEFPERGGKARSHACLFTQELPNLLRNLRDPRVLTVQCVLEDGLIGRVESCAELAEALGKSLIAVSRALAEARARQQRFAEERVRLGRLALSSDFDRAVVILGRPYNAYDPLLNLSLATSQIICADGLEFRLRSGCLHSQASGGIVTS
jgi:predicted nucleotide-binding protein (sugar kinase/HSP70/actin superfamily)